MAQNRGGWWGRLLPLGSRARQEDDEALPAHRGEGTSSPKLPAGRFSWASCRTPCGHALEQGRAGIELSGFCPVCAVDGLTREKDGTVHENEEAIRDWCYEVASVGTQECESLVRQIAEFPSAVLMRWLREQPKFFADELVFRVFNANASVHPITPAQELDLALCDLERIKETYKSCMGDSLLAHELDWVVRMVKAAREGME